MFTKKTRLTVKVYYAIFRFVRSNPFIWDENATQLRITTSSFHMIHWFFNISWFVFYPFYLSREVLHAFQHPGYMSNESIVLDLLFIQGFAYCAFVHLLLLWRKKEIATFVNSYFSYNELCERKFMRNYKNYRMAVDKTQKICETVLALFIPTIFVNPVVTIFLFVKSPDNSRYLYSFIPESWRSRLVFWLCAIWELYFYCNIYCVCYWGLILIMTYVTFNNFWLSQTGLSVSAEASGLKLTNDSLRTPKEAIKMYRALQLINVHFNACFSNLFTPSVKIFNVVCHVFGIYGMIELHGIVAIPAYFLFPLLSLSWIVFEFVAYPLLGRIHHLCEEFVWSWKQKVKSRYYLTEMRSFVLMEIKVSHMYALKKTSVLTIFLFIVNASINLMIMI